MTRCPAPNRLMIGLDGVRDIDFDSLSESLLETSAVQDAYRMMVLDDSRFGVVIVLNPGWSCEVSEYTDPGALMLSFKEDAGAEEEGAVYYLRTEAMPYTEELGLLCEEYHAESPTQLKTLGGEYIVTLGQYGSESEALEALDALNSKYGSPKTERNRPRQIERKSNRRMRRNEKDYQDNNHGRPGHGTACGLRRGG